MSVISLAAYRQQSLLEKLRNHQAELSEAYRRKSFVLDIPDQLLDEVQRTLSPDERLDYEHALEMAWAASRHSDDDMSYAHAVLYHAVRILEGRK